MKEKINIPGPARAMYGTYLGSLLLVLYTGFFLYHPFMSGWRYPWSMSLMAEFNFVMSWVLVLTAFVFLYYQTLGRPEGWNEPLVIFRVVISLVTIWFFLLMWTVYQPYGWIRGLTDALGGPTGAVKWYEIFLWVMLLVNVIYLYSRWVKSERFPHLTAGKSRG